MMARHSRLVTAAGVVVGAGIWLWLRAAPPRQSRAVFGLWKARDVGVALALLYVALVALCSSRRAYLRLVAISLSCVFSWGLLEVAYATMGHGAMPSVLGSERLPHADIRGETPPDTAAAFGLPFTARSFHYTTNVHGHRNPPDRDFGDVYCVGDSCLVAAMLDWPDTLVSQLERRLSRPCVNVALIGLAPQEAQREFEHAASGHDLEGRVVLQFLCEDNDLLDSRRVTQMASAPKPDSLWDRSLLRRGFDAFQRLTQPVVAEASRRTGQFGDTTVRFLWVHRRGDACEQQWPQIEQALNAFRASIEARHGRLGVILIPQKLRVLGPFSRFPAGSDLMPLADHLTPMPERLADWSVRSGCAVLDLTASLKVAAASGRLVWLADDTHWSADGASVAADAVSAWPWLQAQLTTRPR